MTYKEAIDYLYQLEFFGIKLGLDNIRRLLDYMDNPQRNFRVIHIAGTNGKGSVSAYISNILQSAGYQVGRYTSPHLERFEERICINGQSITEDEVVRLVEYIRPLAQKLSKEPGGVHPTFFEITTAMAFQYFHERKVDFTVLEVGLGGRLDATNVVNANISIITNIDFDHTKQLGNTIPEIAREKAGIIKNNSICITGAEGEALKEIEKIAKKTNSRLVVYPKDISYRNLGVQAYDNFPQIPKYQNFYVFGLLGNYPNLRTNQLGEYQLINATLAIAAVETLILHAFPELRKGNGIDERKIRTYLEYQYNRPQKLHSLDSGDDYIPLVPTDDDDSALSVISRILLKSIPEGIQNTHWPGRIEVVNKMPLVILDGAHNPAGARVLRNSIQSLFKYRKLIMLMGISAGKEANIITDILCPLADEVIVTSAKYHKMIAPDELGEMIKNKTKSVKIVKTVKNAVEYAFKSAEPDDMICICGSLYVVGEARPLFKNADLLKEQL